MAMRLRVVDGAWLALCAAEHPAQDGDVYLDDAQDHAVREKLWADWDSERRLWPTVRITSGAAGARFHIVREGSDPLESLCARAYVVEAKPRTVLVRDLMSWTTACRTCLKVRSGDQGGVQE